MDARWFKGVADKEERRKQLQGFARAYEVLAELLETELVEKAPDYSSPSWAYEQADRNGANRMIKSILKLLNVKDQK